MQVTRDIVSEASYLRSSTSWIFLQSGQCCDSLPMFKFMSSSEPYKYHVGLPPALRLLTLMESHHKTRHLLAKDLVESGQCANDLLRKVIFPQIQDSGVPTHSSTNTPQMHPTVNQPGLPALGHYVHGNSPCKRVLCSEDDDDAGSPPKTRLPRWTRQKRRRTPQMR